MRDKTFIWERTRVRGSIIESQGSCKRIQCYTLSKFHEIFAIINIALWSEKSGFKNK